MKYEIKINSQNVECIYRDAIPQISFGRDRAHLFKAPLKEYDGFTVYRSQDVDASGFTLEISHQSDSKKNVTLYSKILLTGDSDPELIEKFHYFRSKLEDLDIPMGLLIVLAISKNDKTVTDFVKPRRRFAGQQGPKPSTELKNME